MQKVNERDVAYTLAEAAVSRSFSDLSTSTVLATANAFLDSLAVALAGTNAPGVPEARRAFARWKSDSGVSVWGGFGTMPSPLAATLNAASMHALDFDDTDDKVPLHAQSVLLPALIADLEENRPDCDGQEFLTALAVGIDGTMRVGRAGGPKGSRGWNYSVISGGMGAVLGLARLRRWSADKTVSALGHQLAQTAGSLQSIIDGSLAKRFQPAMMAKNALMAVALTEAGIDGPRNVFEGRAGFFPLYQDGKFDKATLLADLESSGLVNDLSLKPYSSCRFTHASIDVALELHRQGVRSADVKRVHIVVSGQAVNMVGRHFDCATAGVVDAQFSIAYTVAVALARGAVRIADFTIERIRDEQIGRFAKENIVIEASDAVPFLSMAPVKFEMELNSGRKIQVTGEHVAGSPEQPLSAEQLRDKVMDCLDYNKSSVDPGVLIKSVQDLPTAGSLRDVLGLLSRK